MQLPYNCNCQKFKINCTMLFRSISMATLGESSLTTRSNVSGILISTSEGWETMAEEATLHVSKSERSSTRTVTDKRVHMHSENSSRDKKREKRVSLKQEPTWRANYWPNRWHRDSCRWDGDQRAGMPAAVALLWRTGVHSR